jgi:hypothetical protein
MSDTRRIVTAVYLLGLSTCFLPQFSVSPPALGKTDWSAWDVFELVTSGPTVEWFSSATITRLWIIYALLAGGLLLLSLPQYVKSVSMCTITILWLILRYGSDPYSISHILKRQAGWHEGTLITNPEAFVLPVLMVFLLVVLSIELKIRPRPGEP